jgi:hydroxypyruvate isomerase
LSAKKGCQKEQPFFYDDGTDQSGKSKWCGCFFTALKVKRGEAGIGKWWGE